ncbi:ABC transporter permease [Deinococcus arcticus]|uniref:Peptide ABC transporter permease n=1 Tax=Deinococcus arcticus TaxID=2136176 RepID=A0A2T3W7Z5_9DEIO|nr:ABC transporter permease [Deinococcus arcticus]PTA68031.1 peptide ABC transporter permease [Deinococcus arcticus]
MLNFILRRIVQIPVVMLVLSLMIVGLTQLLTPEQRAAPYIRSEQQAARLEQIIEQRGLRDPFVVQYSRWLGATLKGDLGYSKASSQDVIVTIKERLPRTIELTLVTAIPILLISIWLGTLSALHKDKLLDQVLRVLVVLGYSLPSFVVGILLLAIFYAYLGWAPQAGNVSTEFTVDYFTMPKPTGFLTIDAALAGKWNLFLDALWHMMLPALTLVIVLSASIIKVMRNNMLEALTSDYVRTARAKGLSSRVVNNKHARRNALLSIVTLAGFLIIGLLSGSLITETIFAYPGIGQWVVDAARGVDLAAVLGFAMLSAIIVVVVSTIVDILYGVIDPRVRFD